MDVLSGWSGYWTAGWSEETAAQPQGQSQHMDKMKMWPEKIKKTKSLLYLGNGG